MKIKRKRVLYFVIIILLVIMGLGSRRFAGTIPKFIAEYSGDVLWAMMVFFLIGFLFPKINTKKSILYALVISFSIEISQLYHDNWIDNIRRTILGRLVLGWGFLWSDLVCYVLGITIGGVVENIIEKVYYRNSGEIK